VSLGLSCLKARRDEPGEFSSTHLTFVIAITDSENSVNSFGFGGANAHCILESHMPTSSVARPITNGSLSNGALSNGSLSSSLTNDSPTNNSIADGAHPSAPCFIPFVFSAASDKSLNSMLESTIEFLDKNGGVDISNLVYTLSTRRSVLSRRLAISAASVEQLQEGIKGRLEAAAADDDSSLGISALPGAPSILGIFTGQGAQWPAMGSKLFASSPIARATLSDLDASLASLPTYHRPSWTLMDELSADSKSRVGEAAISQPLCAAVQIVLVDLLRAAGVRFRAVVGHSSGEIAAAYTAGFLNASDAIRIAYYRGYFAKLAAGPTGEKGGMMAVGTDFEDASELCQVDDFVERLCVAAHNSPTSVTLSGDIDAIIQAQNVLEEEKKFARALRVDTAYHSVHMLRCSLSYLKALKECCIQPLQPEPDAPKWFSSVYNSRIMADTEHLDGTYWVQNMVQPVLFYPATQTCLASTGKFTVFNPLYIDRCPKTPGH
jgi:acyl transferase domain-containing protein